MFLVKAANSFLIRPQSFTSFRDTFSHHYGNEEAPEGTKCLLWFGGCHVENFGLRGKADISKFGVSSNLQTNFHRSLRLERNNKGYIRFGTRWDKEFSSKPLP
ncbi:hypothetical protein TNIN_9091 [Trichonephila inaurata madagascariensis]|uniref:Uncharacterized protein n=1 Tax=Trichonephila inaurata madagascariensis TaxID=2747483 RepID=A0A8X6XMX1_9ARAC|nr:hypothetical protein TNIN_9091 [Trichonephila inaurata madagascariensis]